MPTVEQALDLINRNKEKNATAKNSGVVTTSQDPSASTAAVILDQQASLATTQDTKDTTTYTQTALPSIPSMDANDTAKGRTIKTYVNPQPLLAEALSNQIWFELTAIPVYKLTNNVRATTAFAFKSSDEKGASGGKVTGKGSSDFGTQLATVLDAQRYKFKFLAQTELMETITHTWEPYDSIASHIAGLYASVSTGIEQLRGLSPDAQGKSFENLIATLVGKGASGIRTLISKMGNTVPIMVNTLNNWAKGGYVANYRVDTPLQYKGSERRSFELIFNLINTESGRNYDNVVEPVKVLQMISTPSYKKDRENDFNADIILPYLFEVNTTPGDLIRCDIAVLKSVNPTWKGPWIDGYPSRCELRLSFTEYRPLEQGVFYGQNKTNRITAMQNERLNAYPGDTTNPAGPTAPKNPSQIDAGTGIKNKKGKKAKYNKPSAATPAVTTSDSMQYIESGGSGFSLPKSQYSSY